MTFGKNKDDKEVASITPAPHSINAGSTVAGTPRPEAYFGKGCKIIGTLTFTGAAEIEGDVEGEIHSQDRLVIGESADVRAKIVGADVLIKGTVSGDVSASKRLVLKKPAQITGNISAAALSIEEGVIFEGKCAMGASVKSESSGKVATLKPLGMEKVAQ